ncbi:MAG TPA: CopD family protein [Gemmatimonadales bacterium]|nr:CopD family protein [Gemmatimonadales bacterium]
MDLSVGGLGYAVARWLGYVAAFGLTGLATAAFIAPHEERLFARGMGIGAAGLALLSLCGRLAGQVATLLEPGQPVLLAVVGEALASRWGVRWERQGLAVLLAVMAVGVPQPVRIARWTAALAAGAVAFTLPLTGHALEFPAGPRWGTLAHGAHLLAGGIWLGSLAVLLASLRRVPVEASAAEAVATWRRFSAVALVAGSFAMALGLVLAWVDVGGWSRLFGSAYGRILLLKLALLGGVVGLGAFHWRRVLPRLPDRAAWRTLVRSGSWEVTLAFVLLGVTALLVATPPPARP